MAAVSTDPLARLEALSELERDRSPSRRMLVIVNPYATTVSEGLKNLVVYALRGRYDVTAVDTQAPGHATELCRQAAQQGYDVVVAFGGDGTVNESANGLIGSDTPLCCLPGGRANVYCRHARHSKRRSSAATEHLLALASTIGSPRANRHRASVGERLLSLLRRRRSRCERRRARVDAHPQAQVTPRPVLLRLGGGFDVRWPAAIIDPSAADWPGLGCRSVRHRRHAW